MHIDCRMETTDLGRHVVEALQVEGPLLHLLLVLLLCSRFQLTNKIRPRSVHTHTCSHTCIHTCTLTLPWQHLLGGEAQQLIRPKLPVAEAQDQHVITAEVVQ